MHQQVGPTYEFDQEKREGVVQRHISTMVSDHDNFKADAKQFFNNEIGLKLNVPDIILHGDGVLTYGALTMKDYVANGLWTENMEFTKEDSGKIEVDAYRFGSQNFPEYVRYVKGDNYQAFECELSTTSLWIVLPDETIALDDVDVCEAYDMLKAQKSHVAAIGCVPYFHTKTESIDITNALTENMTGGENLYSSLLKDDVANDLFVTGVIQSSDFEFNNYGVSGESITVIESEGSAMPSNKNPVSLIVDRPFYAISVKDDFPLFVSKIYDPSTGV